MIRRYFAFSIVLLLLLFIAAGIDNYNQEWKRYQRDYLYQVKEAQKGGSVSLGDRIQVERQLEIRKVVTEVGRTADFCMTCHLNIDELNAQHAAFNVDTARFPFDQVGCTACHGGQGLALEFERAHEELLDRKEEIFEVSIERLSSDRWRVRQEASELIRWMTGDDFGFSFDDPPEQRQEAIERTKAWWNVHKETFLVEGFGSFGSQEQPFISPNPIRDTIEADTSLSSLGANLRFVGSNTCLACHAHPEISEIYIPQSSKEHVERWMQSAFMTSTHPDLFAERHPFIDKQTANTLDVTCEACHGPGQQYVSMMQKGLALQSLGDEGAATEILGTAKEIATGNAHRNVNDPAIWRIFEELIAASVSPPALEVTPQPAEAEPEPAAVERGRQLAQQFGCLGCHTVTGERLVGPTWKGLFDSERMLASGETVTADEVYLRESILNPNAKVVQDFLPNIMPNLGSALSDDDLDAIIAYIKSLSAGD
ncbi:MAG: c-type cytochrome [Candidatus Bipolaricaulia bacterium]